MNSVLLHNTGGTFTETAINITVKIMMLHHNGFTRNNDTMQETKEDQIHSTGEGGLSCLKGMEKMRTHHAVLTCNKHNS
jgi:hypothetical protein